MSAEGSLGRPESAAGPRGKEQGFNAETEGIPEWSLNVRTYDLLQEGHCTYNAEEQSLVWPPMLLICSSNDANMDVEYNIGWLRDSLAIEGVQANNVAQTNHVCCEGNKSYHLFVLSPSGLSFAAAKAIDSEHGFFRDVFYPSLKDIFDIKNGRVPEFSRRFVGGLRYHGRPRQAWIDLAVDLVRDDGICVGRGVCQKYEVVDSVDEELLGEFHVGIRVLEVLDNLLPSHWKGSLRRWRTTHVLYNGVSLFECLRQHMQGECKDGFCENGSDSAGIAGVLKDECISSVFPWIGISKDLNEFNHLSSTYSTTCRNALDNIEKNTFKSDSEGPSLHDGKVFATKLDIDETMRIDEIKRIAKDISMKRLWMKHLGTINSSHLVRDVVKRLTVLQKLTASAKSSTLISAMIKEAERMEIGLLYSIEKRVENENKRKMEMDGFDKEMEGFILRKRREQHKELLQELANVNSRHFSTADGLVLGKFKFLNNIERIMKETESVQQWLAHHTAKATKKEKKKWEEQAAKARIEEKKKWKRQAAKARTGEQKKWKEQSAKARLEEQKKWEEQLAKARAEEQKKWEGEVAKALDEEKKKWEEQISEARLEEQKKWQEVVAKARNEEEKNLDEQAAKARMEEQNKCEEISAQVMTELAVARQELADQKEAMPKCAICFEGLEGGSVAKCGQKRSRNDVVLKKRACFAPCMHSSMCLECAVAAWEKFKRCPVCSTSCTSKPQPIFM